MSHHSFQLFLSPCAPSRSSSLTACHHSSRVTSTNFEDASTISAVPFATTPDTREHSSPTSFSVSDAAIPLHTDFLSSRPSSCPASSTCSGFSSQLRPRVLSSLRLTGSVVRNQRAVIGRLPNALSGSATRTENSGSMHFIQFDRPPNQIAAGNAGWRIQFPDCVGIHVLWSRVHGVSP
jgi:hypothetical protein